ncbi:MAG: Gfo/Idh/MocA family oxidoreductase [Thermoguttaceae bacterium]
MKLLSRRELLARASTVVAAAAAAPRLLPSGVLAAGDTPGPNERIRVGAIGVGGRASLLLDQLPEGARLVALSDCNLSRAESFKAKRKGNWPIYQDYRKLLERKDIDAVIVATAEFQRVTPCIRAAEAGKDIYAEKPLTVYIREGRVLVEAVRRLNRIFQVGSQQRSMELNRIACEFIRKGGLGKLKEVRAVNYPGPGDSPASLPEMPVPQGLDWNMWLNQTAMRPFNPEWMRWSKWREFAGGEMTNWGAHGVDQVQWALGMDGTGPAETWPITPGPNGQVGMRYSNGVEVHFILEKAPMGGAIFIGENGKLEINRNKFASNPKEIAAALIAKVDAAEEERKWSDQTALWQARWHMQNWLDCIRTRARPVADVEIGHRSISVCHLANITRQAGRRLRWDAAKEQFPDDAEANKLLVRPRRAGFQLPGE